MAHLSDGINHSSDNMSAPTTPPNETSLYDKFDFEAEDPIQPIQSLRNKQLALKMITTRPPMEFSLKVSGFTLVAEVARIADAKLAEIVDAEMAIRAEREEGTDKKAPLKKIPVTEMNLLHQEIFLIFDGGNDKGDTTLYDVSCSTGGLPLGWVGGTDV